MKWVLVLLFACAALGLASEERCKKYRCEFSCVGEERKLCHTHWEKLNDGEIICLVPNEGVASAMTRDCYTSPEAAQAACRLKAMQLYEKSGEDCRGYDPKVALLPPQPTPSPTPASKLLSKMKAQPTPTPRQTPKAIIEGKFEVTTYPIEKPVTCANCQCRPFQLYPADENLQIGPKGVIHWEVVPADIVTKNPLISGKCEAAGDSCHIDLIPGTKVVLKAAPNGSGKFVGWARCPCDGGDPSQCVIPVSLSPAGRLLCSGQLCREDLSCGAMFRD